MYPVEDGWRRIDEYFEQALVPDDEGLRAAMEGGRHTTLTNAEVSPNQGRLLALLCGMIGAKRVLEFGTLAAYSTIWMARAVGPDGHVTTLELAQRNADIAAECLELAGVADRVEIRVGKAAQSAARLIEEKVEPYDFVFIDADKPSNTAYLRAAMELTHPGSVIVIDNVVRNGAVLDAESTDPSVQGARAVIAEIAGDDRLEATAFQNVGAKGWDGMALIRRVR